MADITRSDKDEEGRKEEEEENEEEDEEGREEEDREMESKKGLSLSSHFFPSLSLFLFLSLFLASSALGVFLRVSVSIIHSFLALDVNLKFNVFLIRFIGSVSVSDSVSVSFLYLSSVHWALSPSLLLFPFTYSTIGAMRTSDGGSFPASLF